MEVRGTALRSVLIACDEEFGAGSASRVIDALAPELRESMRNTILSASWRPVAEQAALHEAVRVALGHGSLDANRRVGRRAAIDDFNGVYRVFLPLFTWDLLWTTLSRAWLRYNSAGTVEFVDHSDVAATVTIRGVSGYTEAMWHAVNGRVCGIIELAGARDVRARITRWSAVRCDSALEWKR
jgi:hypothetical protein